MVEPLIFDGRMEEWNGGRMGVKRCDGLIVNPFYIHVISHHLH